MLKQPVDNTLQTRHTLLERSSICEVKWAPLNTSLIYRLTGAMNQQSRSSANQQFVLVL